MEQQPLFNAYQFLLPYADDHGVGDRINSTTSYNQIATLLCPSENSSSRPQPPYAALNYVGNLGGPGAIRTFSGTMISPYWGSNLAPSTNAIGIQAITDGTTNTALFSERLMGIAGNPTVTLGEKNNAKRAIFESGTSATINGNDVAGALNVLNACKALPATSDRSPRIGAGKSGSLATLGPPSSIDTITSAHPTRTRATRAPSTWGGTRILAAGKASIPPRAITPAASTWPWPTARSGSSRTA